MGQNKNAAPDFSFQARWGDPVVDGGIAPIPMVFLSNYAKLGISPNEGMAIIHAFSYKWTADDPFPSMGTIAGLMGKSRRQVIRYFNDLEDRGFLIKTERVAENGSPLSCMLNFKPLLDACMRVDKQSGDSHGGGGSVMDVTGGVVSPMSHEEKAVPEEKAVQTAATPPAAATASPTEKISTIPSSEVPTLTWTDLPKEYQDLPFSPEEQEQILRRFQRPASFLATESIPLKDPAEEIRTIEDAEHWARELGYRDIQRDIKIFGAMVVLSKVIAFERAVRHGEIRAHNKAGYFNWLLHSTRD